MDRTNGSWLHRILLATARGGTACGARQRDANPTTKPRIALARRGTARALVENLSPASCTTAVFPLLVVLLDSPSPLVLMRRVEQLTASLTGSYGISILSQGYLSIVIRFDSTDGGSRKPTDARLLFLGLRTLLRGMGCRGVTMKRHRPLIHIRQSAGPARADDTRRAASSQIRRFSWTRFEHASAMEGSTTGIGLDDSTRRAVERIIGADLTQQHPLKEVAQRLGVGPRTLQRQLRKEGTSMSLLYREVKIRAASLLLPRPELSLTEIGQLSGFADGAHFARTFRQTCHMTPSVYRNLLGIGTENLARHQRPADDENRGNTHRRPTSTASPALP